MDDKIFDAIISFLSRTATAEELQQLRDWLEGDAAHRDELIAWFRAWEASGVADRGRFDAKAAFQRFMFRQNISCKPETKGTTKHLRETRFETAMRSFRRMAAVFILGFVAGGLAWFFMSRHTPTMPVSTFAESIVPLGSKSLLRLPDGSTVWLNAGSKLRYPVDYGLTERNVYLVGEGYFKVAKQPDKPFVVHTDLMKVRALGTEFNVKAYPGDKCEETTLVNGEVEVDRGDKGGFADKVVLRPGQKVSIATAPETKPAAKATAQPEKTAEHVEPLVSKPSPDEAQAEVSWKDRNWRIEREELQSLAVKLERRYDVHIQVADGLKHHRFTGTLKDESLEQVLTAMQLSAPISFTVSGKSVRIYPSSKRVNKQ